MSMTHQVYRGVCLAGKADDPAYCRVDIGAILAPYYDVLARDKPNNLFFTTAALRDYHYTKQKNNGYYHLRAMNLPFQNIEFCIAEETAPVTESDITEEKADERAYRDQT